MVKWGMGEAREGFAFRSCDYCEIAIQTIDFNERSQDMRAAGGNEDI